MIWGCWKMMSVSKKVQKLKTDAEDDMKKIIHTDTKDREGGLMKK